MEVSLQKSTFFQNRVQDDNLDIIKSILTFEVEILSKGIKCLGFFLKPNCYLKEDWTWLFKKVDHTIIIGVSGGSHLGEG